MSALGILPPPLCLMAAASGLEKAHTLHLKIHFAVSKWYLTSYLLPSRELVFLLQLWPAAG